METITPADIVATLKASSIRFLFIGDFEFGKKLTESIVKEIAGEDGFIITDRAIKFGDSQYQTCLMQTYTNGHRADVVIVEKEPTEKEATEIIKPILSSRNNRPIIRAKGCYIAHIPENPKILEERVAILEQLVAEGQKLKL